jgi:hypothetical protein
MSKTSKGVQKAEPPGTIAKTFKRRGGLQMHRLVDRARFRCVECSKYRSTTLVATRDGDWAQTLCSLCYDLLAAGLATKSQTAKAQKRRPPQTSREQRLNGVEPKRRLQLMSVVERREFEDRLPGVSQVPAFFREAGVQADLIRAGRLSINGRLTPPLADIVPSHGLRDWNDVIDAIAVSYAGDRFIAAMAENARFGDGLRAFFRRHEKAFVVMRDGARLAAIRATRTEIPHRQVVRANFLKPGPHWQQVADILHRAEPELVALWQRERDAKARAEAAAAAVAAEQSRAAAANMEQRLRARARRRIDHLPNDLAAELVEACLHASRRIRLERQVAYERPVVLQYTLGELTLLPITRAQTRLLLPFRLSTGSTTVTGELLLTDRDPIPLLVTEGATEQEAVTAWTCALLGFADATCITVDSARSPRPRESDRPQGVQRSSRSQAHPTHTLPRRQSWPQHLEPVGHWTRYSGSFVASHRRRLTDGQTASGEAVDHARQVGITLQPNETWVRAHTRGVPDGIEMRFYWHAPSELEQGLTDSHRAS